MKKMVENADYSYKALMKSRARDTNAGLNPEERKEERKKERKKENARGVGSGGKLRK